MRVPCGPVPVLWSLLVLASCGGGNVAGRSDAGKDLGDVAALDTGDGGATLDVAAGGDDGGTGDTTATTDAGDAATTDGADLATSDADGDTVQADSATGADAADATAGDIATGDVAGGDATGDVAGGDVAVGDVAVGDVAVGDAVGGDTADAPDAGPCVQPCDDGLACTDDSCGAEGCVFALQGGWCRIDGQCRPAGQPSVDDPCRACDPAVDPAAFSPLADGTACGIGRACVEGQCKADGPCCTSADCDAGRQCLPADGVACAVATTDFATLDAAAWAFVGSAGYDSNWDYVTLTSADAGQAGCAWYVGARFACGMTADFRVVMTGGSNDADGFAVVLAGDPDTTKCGGGGGNLGAGGLGGVSVRFQHFHSAWSPVRLVRNSDNNVLCTGTVPAWKGLPHTPSVQIRVIGGVVKAFMDEVELLSCDASAALPSGEAVVGFTAATGSSYTAHRLDDLTLSGPCVDAVPTTCQ